MEVIFFDVNAAADFLKVRRSTIYAWVFQRRIPFRRHGRRLVFHRGELESWSKAQAVPVSFLAEAENDKKTPAL